MSVSNLMAKYASFLCGRHTFLLLPFNKCSGFGPNKTLMCIYKALQLHVSIPVKFAISLLYEKCRWKVKSACYSIH